MIYDVPLPPCVERRRQRRRRQLEDANRAYARAGWPLREIDADSERWLVMHGIDDHYRGLTEPWRGGVCSACNDDKWWPVWFSGRDLAGNVLPDRTPDLGTYADEAGHELVRRGVWSPDQLLTARQVAERTAHDFMKGRK